MWRTGLSSGRTHTSNSTPSGGAGCRAQHIDMPLVADARATAGTTRFHHLRYYLPRRYLRHCAVRATYNTCLLPAAASYSTHPAVCSETPLYCRAQISPLPHNACVCHLHRIDTTSLRQYYLAFSRSIAIYHSVGQTDGFASSGNMIWRLSFPFAVTGRHSSRDSLPACATVQHAACRCDRAPLRLPSAAPPIYAHYLCANTPRDARAIRSPLLPTRVPLGALGYRIYPPPVIRRLPLSLLALYVWTRQYVTHANALANSRRIRHCLSLYTGAGTTTGGISNALP